ncbi:MAG: cysteine hydrolase [Candidatus Heimdallarchaeota archaeon]
MKKENYFNKNNKDKKILEWKKILSNYYSSKKNIKFKKDNAAILIIDMQDYFLDSSSHAYLPASETITEPIKKLQDAFHSRNKAVFFTKYGLTKGLDDNIMHKWWNGSLYIDNPLAKISGIFDTNEATVISKTTYDVFIGTNFLHLLTKLGYTQLVITGVATHLCCETTARSAFCYDKNVFLPIDCLATYTEELHLNSLKAAAHGFAVPTTSKEILEMIDDE